MGNKQFIILVAASFIGIIISIHMISNSILF